MKNALHSGHAACSRLIPLVCASLFLLAGPAPLGTFSASAETLEAHQNYRCPYCHYYWEDDNYGRTSECPHCLRRPDGSMGSSSTTAPLTMPVPRNSAEMGQYIGATIIKSMADGFQQGIAAQQEAERRAAEEAAAAEKRRQELLKKAAVDARASWEQQDAANLAEFNMTLSSGKKSGGLSPLMQKQLAAARAAQQAATPFGDPTVVLDTNKASLASQTGTNSALPATPFGDPNVVDLSDMTNNPNLIPQIPGSGTVAAASGTPQVPGRLAANVPAAPPPIVTPPPTQTLSVDWKSKLPAISDERREFIKEKAKDMGFEYASMFLEKFVPGVESIIDTAKTARIDLNFGKKLTAINSAMFNDTMDVASEAIANPTGDWGHLADKIDVILHTGAEKNADLAKETIRSFLGNTSDEASIGEGTVGANIILVNESQSSGENKRDH